jgi:Ni/Fe-hydrogenase subunit HybB-like protein
MNPAMILSRAEQLRVLAAWLRPRLDQALIFFIILGVTLPTMHQSSLGSMLLVAATKLHPLWHTGILPLLFLINCMYIGYAIAIIQLLITAYAFKRPYDLEELSGVARVVPYLTAIWLTVALGDLTYRQQWAAAFRFDLYSCSFLLEIGLIVAGSLLLLRKEHRHSPRWLYISAALIVLGGGLYRVNVYMIGFDPGQGWKYFPSLAEIMVTVGIVALEILGYQVLVKLCPVLPRIKLPGRARVKDQRAAALLPLAHAPRPAYAQVSQRIPQPGLKTV